MRVLPAIDLKDGQCVRLQKGDYGTATQGRGGRGADRAGFP